MSSFTIKSASQLIKERGLQQYGSVQRYVDKEVIRIMTPYVPKDTGELIRSATRLTKIGSGMIIQGGEDAPYGRRWYYEKANFTGAPMRGNKWFDRSMSNGGKKIILKGVQKML